MMEAKAWYEKVVIPTYGTGKPEKNPVFPEKRVYQGSSGVVYPHPVIEKIEDEKKNVKWDAVFLENSYLKVMVLPQLGGRVQMAYDKMKKRHFVYHNQVIKPALVGLTGPWISGGIEFNWPQHHRPSTYEPTDHKIEYHADGSVTVWCNELERMFRTRGMAGFTLHPRNAYLEIRVKLYNRTDFPQTFLWWANPAVKVNDAYQSVFPPDVNAVFDHGKRDVSEFPVAKGTYYKVDYSPGTDISRYRNIPVPTSYMAITSDYDFVGGYEHDSRAGLLHVANHHISPGKKQWTWGHGDFGQAWDRNLTDEDGPYIELMCGVYTDNQPDFSWLMPGEEKTFSQYFMPYRDLGVVKNATKEAMLNLETKNRRTTIRVFTTAAYPDGIVELTAGGELLVNDRFGFHPGTSYEHSVELPAGVSEQDLYLSVKTAEGICLVDWSPGVDKKQEIPEPAKPAKQPEDITSNEQLYLTGLHLEQYRHATYDPRPYYEEALRRDPGDSRCNNALGLYYLRRGQFKRAETFFLRTIETLTERNPNPIDGEPYHHLGIAQRYLNRPDEAYKTFYKSVWNAHWMDSGYFQIARIETLKGKWEQALEVIDRSLARNGHHHKARQLKVSILRHLGREEEALAFIEDSVRMDGFNFSLYFERYLIIRDESALNEMKQLMRGNIHTYIEFALDYGWSGLYEEAIQLLQTGIAEQGNGVVYPMAYYFLAWFHTELNDQIKARDALEHARRESPEYCFPNQPEAVVALQRALQLHAEDYKALYYLGNFWYAHKNYEEAVRCWEQSIEVYPGFPTTHRNYALACFNKRGEPDKALTSLETAFRLDPSDARILMELDQLYKRQKHSLRKRLEFLEKHRSLVDERDDLYLELVTLYNLTGKYQVAFDLLMARRFHPWEGGEGKTSGQYVCSLTGLARSAIDRGEVQLAIELLTRSRTYPPNLGEGKLPGTQENEVLYLLGVAYERLQNHDLSSKYYREASAGLNEVSAAMYYNDQQPDTIYFRGKALQKLGKESDALACFDSLIDYGKKHQSDRVQIDYFAVSLPDLLIWEDDLDFRNRQLCHYLMGLGYLGKNEPEKARKYIEAVLRNDPAHPKASVLDHLI